MPLGIIAATFAEARILFKGRIAAGEAISLGEGVFLLLSGIGSNRARMGAQALLGKRVTFLVSWGSAGGLLPGLSAGTLILPERILASDQSVYHVDPAWHEALSILLKGYIDFHKGTLAESTTVLASCGEKSNLFSRTGAIAVDMESASIAQVAKEAGIPFMAIRAITDAAETAVPHCVLSSIDEFGGMRLSKLLSCLARRPLDLLTSLRLGRDFQAARATLTAVSRHAGPHWLGA